jgi:long-subunit fatty acid transport protein
MFTARARVLGARIGLHYAPIETLQFGLTYTSKVTTKLEGTSKTVLPVGDPLEFDAHQDIPSPHALRLGGSIALLDKKLLLALDLKANFYANSNKKSVTVIEDVPNPADPTMTADQRVVVDQSWKNAYAAGLGAEYRVIDPLVLRLGYSMTNSATPQKTASLIGIGPGMVYAFHGGLGVRALPSLDLDLGAFYAFASSEIPETKPNGGPYDMGIVMGALSATYHR